MGFIQAAALLLQVLGKAGSFVGLGRRTMRRSELSPKAWQQLSQLIGES